MDCLKILAGLAATTLLAGCATEPPPAPTANIDPVERVRANSALDVFQDLATRDEWYGVYFRGELGGQLERKRSVRNGEIRIVTTVTSTNDNIQAFTILEHFDAGAPHDATLLEIREDNGDVSRVVKMPDGYVAEATRNGVSKRDTLFDFRYRLADLLAAEIWVRDGAEAGNCLSYPGYSLTDFSRQFNRECIVREDEHLFDGEEIEAVVTRLNGSVRIKRARESGMELVTRQTRNVELRLARRSIVTQRGGPDAAGPVILAASEVGVQLQK